ncbi:seminal metalloprotease 1 [Drosophila elegans]|uniref:seminal metalloprotease 1 n=1 Tax=Drosophila elegans TaxID=30023 RepID=UPI0007E6BA45|nr:seminal metalloprotease 1 [Drosophila elegans]
MFALTLALIVFLAREGFNEPAQDPELLEQYFEGDISVRPIQFRNGIANKILHWPNGVVKYRIEQNDFDDIHYKEILRAISIIEANSCVVFRIASQEELPQALIITSKGVGCNCAYLGFRNRTHQVNLQNFPLGKGCFRIGSILHEFLHVLGFEHQHVSRNRDQYVSIKWDNINPEFKINFVNTDNTTDWHDFGEGYDYQSVMHYVPKAFSKNGKPTIVALKEGSSNMGQRFNMSVKDIRKLNKMYNCPGYV